MGLLFGRNGFLDKVGKGLDSMSGGVLGGLTKPIRKFARNNKHAINTALAVAAVIYVGGWAATGNSTWFMGAEAATTGAAAAGEGTVLAPTAASPGYYAAADTASAASAAGTSAEAVGTYSGGAFGSGEVGAQLGATAAQGTGASAATAAEVASGEVGAGTVLSSGEPVVETSFGTKMLNAMKSVGGFVEKHPMASAMLLNTAANAMSPDEIDIMREQARIERKRREEYTKSFANMGVTSNAPTTNTPQYQSVAPARSGIIANRMRY